MKKSRTICENYFPVLCLILQAYFRGQCQSQWHLWGWHATCTAVQGSTAGSSDRNVLGTLLLVCLLTGMQRHLPDGRTNVFRMQRDFIVMLKQWMSVAYLKGWKKGLYSQIINQGFKNETHCWNCREGTKGLASNGLLFWTSRSLVKISVQCQCLNWAIANAAELEPTRSTQLPLSLIWTGRWWRECDLGHGCSVLPHPPQPLTVVASRNQSGNSSAIHSSMQQTILF